MMILFVIPRATTKNKTHIAKNVNTTDKVSKKMLFAKRRQERRKRNKAQTRQTGYLSQPH